MRMLSALIVLALASVSQASAQKLHDPVRPMFSATKARDINGFALGMHIRDVNKITPVEGIGGGQFNASHDGNTYNFEVTPLGRVFRITFSQPLGRFAVDNIFARSLVTKLAAKYGPPASGSHTNFYWDLIQSVTHVGGRVLPFTTMWMTAYVSGGPGVDEQSLEMVMIDFRLLWQDEAKLNREPGNRAAAKVSF